MLKEFHTLTSAKDNRLKQLYRTIRKLGTSDISQLKKITGFKHATCVRMLDELIEKNLIDDSGVGLSSGGRKPKVYQINPTKNLLVGAEISHLYTTVVLEDLTLDIKEVRKLKMDEFSTPLSVLDFITASITEMLANYGATRVDLLGIGVGLLTRIDPDTNSILADEFFTARGWHNFDIVAYLSEQNNVKVLLEAATNLAALAEYRKNYWNSVDSLLFVSSDLIIRSAAIFNGQLLYRKSEMVESLGHMIVEINGNECPCGAFGCLHTYSTLPVVFQEIIKKLKMGYPSSLSAEVADLNDLTYFHILQGIEEEDPLCLEVIREASFYFGIGLSNLILQLNPKEVILGGTLGPRMFEITQETIDHRLNLLGITGINLHKASAAFNTVSQGAGCLVFDYYVEEELFL